MTDKSGLSSLQQPAVSSKTGGNIASWTSQGIHSSEEEPSWEKNQSGRRADRYRDRNREASSVRSSRSGGGRKREEGNKNLHRRSRSQEEQHHDRRSKSGHKTVRSADTRSRSRSSRRQPHNQDDQRRRGQSKQEHRPGGSGPARRCSRRLSGASTISDGELDLLEEHKQKDLLDDWLRTDDDSELSLDYEDLYEDWQGQEFDWHGQNRHGVEQAYHLDNRDHHRRDWDRNWDQNWDRNRDRDWDRDRGRDRSRGLPPMDAMAALEVAHNILEHSKHHHQQHGRDRRRRSRSLSWERRPHHRGRSRSPNPPLPRSHNPPLPRSHSPPLPSSRNPPPPRSHNSPLPCSRNPPSPRSHNPPPSRSHNAPLPRCSPPRGHPRTRQSREHSPQPAVFCDRSPEYIPFDSHERFPLHWTSPTDARPRQPSPNLTDAYGVEKYGEHWKTPSPGSHHDHMRMERTRDRDGSRHDEITLDRLVESHSQSQSQEERIKMHINEERLRQEWLEQPKTPWHVDRVEHSPLDRKSPRGEYKYQGAWTRKPQSPEYVIREWSSMHVHDNSVRHGSGGRPLEEPRPVPAPHREMNTAGPLTTDQTIDTPFDPYNLDGPDPLLSHETKRPLRQVGGTTFKRQSVLQIFDYSNLTASGGTTSTSPRPTSGVDRVECIGESLLDVDQKSGHFDGMVSVPQSLTYSGTGSLTNAIPDPGIVAQYYTRKLPSPVSGIRESLLDINQKSSHFDGMASVPRSLAFSGTESLTIAIPDPVKAAQLYTPKLPSPVSSKAHPLYLDPNYDPSKSPLYADPEEPSEILPDPVVESKPLQLVPYGSEEAASDRPLKLVPYEEEETSLKTKEQTSSPSKRHFEYTNPSYPMTTSQTHCVDRQFTTRYSRSPPVSRKRSLDSGRYSRSRSPSAKRPKGNMRRSRSRSRLGSNSRQRSHVSVQTKRTRSRSPSIWPSVDRKQEFCARESEPSSSVNPRKRHVLAIGDLEIKESKPDLTRTKRRSSKEKTDAEESGVRHPSSIGHRTDSHKVVPDILGRQQRKDTKPVSFTIAMSKKGFEDLKKRPSKGYTFGEPSQYHGGVSCILDVPMVERKLYEEKMHPEMCGIPSLTEGGQAEKNKHGEDTTGSAKLYESRVKDKHKPVKNNIPEENKYILAAQEIARKISKSLEGHGEYEKSVTREPSNSHIGTSRKTKEQAKRFSQQNNVEDDVGVKHDMLKFACGMMCPVKGCKSREFFSSKEAYDNHWRSYHWSKLYHYSCRLCQNTDLAPDPGEPWQLAGHFSAAHPLIKLYSLEENLIEKMLVKMPQENPNFVQPFPLIYRCDRQAFSMTKPDAPLPSWGLKDESLQAQQEGVISEHPSEASVTGIHINSPGIPKGVQEMVIFEHISEAPVTGIQIDRPGIPQGVQEGVILEHTSEASVAGIQIDRPGIPQRVQEGVILEPIRRATVTEIHIDKKETVRKEAQGHKMPVPKDNSVKIEVKNARDKKLCSWNDNGKQAMSKSSAIPDTVSSKTSQFDGNTCSSADQLMVTTKNANRNNTDELITSDNKLWLDAVPVRQQDLVFKPSLSLKIRPNKVSDLNEKYKFLGARNKTPCKKPSRWNDNSKQFIPISTGMSDTVSGKTSQFKNDIPEENECILAAQEIARKLSNSLEGHGEFEKSVTREPCNAHIGTSRGTKEQAKLSPCNASKVRENTDKWVTSDNKCWLDISVQHQQDSLMKPLMSLKIQPNKISASGQLSAAPSLLGFAPVEETKTDGSVARDVQPRKVLLPTPGTKGAQDFERHFDRTTVEKNDVGKLYCPEDGNRFEAIADFKSHWLQHHFNSNFGPCVLCMDNGLIVIVKTAKFLLVKHIREFHATKAISRDINNRMLTNNKDTDEPGPVKGTDELGPVKGTDEPGPVTAGPATRAEMTCCEPHTRFQVGGCSSPVQGKQESDVKFCMGDLRKARKLAEIKAVKSMGELKKARKLAEIKAVKREIPVDAYKPNLSYPVPALTCPITHCGVSGMSTQEEVQAHLNFQHSEKVQQYTCLICEKSGNERVNPVRSLPWSMWEHLRWAHHISPEAMGEAKHGVFPECLVGLRSVPNLCLIPKSTKFLTSTSQELMEEGSNCIWNLPNIHELPLELVKQSSCPGLMCSILPKADYAENLKHWLSLHASDYVCYICCVCGFTEGKFMVPRFHKDSLEVMRDHFQELHPWLDPVTVTDKHVNLMYVVTEWLPNIELIKTGVQVTCLHMNDPSQTLARMGKKIGQLIKSGSHCPVPSCSSTEKFGNPEDYISHWNDIHERYVAYGMSCTECEKSDLIYFVKHTWEMRFHLTLAHGVRHDIDHVDSKRQWKSKVRSDFVPNSRFVDPGTLSLKFCMNHIFDAQGRLIKDGLVRFWAYGNKGMRCVVKNCSMKLLDEACFREHWVTKHCPRIKSCVCSTCPDENPLMSEGQSFNPKTVINHYMSTHPSAMWLHQDSVCVPPSSVKVLWLDPPSSVCTSLRVRGVPCCESVPGSQDHITFPPIPTHRTEMKSGLFPCIQTLSNSAQSASSEANGISVVTASAKCPSTDLGSIASSSAGCEKKDHGFATSGKAKSCRHSKTGKRMFRLKTYKTCPVPMCNSTPLSLNHWCLNHMKHRGYQCLLCSGEAAGTVHAAWMLRTHLLSAHPSVRGFANRYSIPNEVGREVFIPGLHFIDPGPFELQMNPRERLSRCLTIHDKFHKTIPATREDRVSWLLYEQTGVEKQVFWGHNGLCPVPKCIQLFPLDNPLPLNQHWEFRHTPWLINYTCEKCCVSFLGLAAKVRHIKRFHPNMPKEEYKISYEKVPSPFYIPPRNCRTQRISHLYKLHDKTVTVEPDVAVDPVEVVFHSNMLCPVPGCQEGGPFGNVEEFDHHWLVHHHPPSTEYICLLCGSFWQGLNGESHFALNHPEIDRQTLSEKGGLQYLVYVVVFRKDVRNGPYVYKLKCGLSLVNSTNMYVEFTSRDIDVNDPRFRITFKKDAIPLVFVKNMVCPVLGCLSIDCFPSKNVFDEHWSLNHTPTRTMHRCEYCGDNEEKHPKAMFSLVSELNKHMVKRHKDQKVCGKETNVPASFYVDPWCYSYTPKTVSGGTSALVKKCKDTSGQPDELPPQDEMGAKPGVVEQDCIASTSSGTAQPKPVTPLLSLCIPPPASYVGQEVYSFPRYGLGHYVHTWMGPPGVAGSMTAERWSPYHGLTMGTGIIGHQSIGTGYYGTPAHPFGRPGLLNRPTGIGTKRKLSTNMSFGGVHGHGWGMRMGAAKTKKWKNLTVKGKSHTNPPTKKVKKG